MDERKPNQEQKPTPKEPKKMKRINWTRLHNYLLKKHADNLRRLS